VAPGGLTKLGQISDGPFLCRPVFVPGQISDGPFLCPPTSSANSPGRSTNSFSPHRAFLAPTAHPASGYPVASRRRSSDGAERLRLSGPVRMVIKPPIQLELPRFAEVGTTRPQPVIPSGIVDEELQTAIPMNTLGILLLVSQVPAE
jgi:hypothetical protein